ncbi:MAG: hypothetical protein U0441_24310 [Polyangiaceae bacterium]
MKAARFACVVACIALASSSAACGGKKKGSGSGVAGAGTAGEPQAPPEPDGIRRYRHIATGLKILPTHEMDPKEATTVWHYRVEWANNRVVKTERVTPNGGVQETMLVEYRPDGSRVEHVRDAYGVEIYSDTIDRTAVVTRMWRSGEQINDGCYWRRRTFDSFGRMETNTCLDDKSMVITDANGCAVVRYQWNVSNDVQTKVCLKNDMSPAYDAGGVHRTTYERDLYGYVTDESYYGAQNERTQRLSDGCLRVTYKRDEAGAPIETICTDEKGQSTFVRAGGYTTIQSKYDQNGCLVEKKFVDFDGKTPKKGVFGSTTFTVDKRCGVLSETNKDPRGRPVSFEVGKPPIEERELAADGLWTKRTCKGASGPVACSDPKRTNPKGSIVTVDRDEMGRVTSMKCFQKGDKPSPCDASTPFERRLEYGSDGRVRAEAYFDEKGQPALANGIARVERKFTSVGKPLTENFLDKDGAPMLNKGGVASLTYQYDIQQRVAAILAQGTDGQPRASRGFVLMNVAWPPGAAKVTVDRENEAKLANVFLGPDDKLVKRLECADPAVPCYRR